VIKTHSATLSNVIQTHSASGIKPMNHILLLLVKWWNNILRLLVTSVQSLPRSSEFYSFYCVFYHISRRRNLKCYVSACNIKYIMSRIWECPPKWWKGCNILQLFRTQTSMFCVKSAVIIIFSKCNCRGSRNSLSASRPRYFASHNVCPAGICAVVVHHNCTTVAP